MEQGQGEGQAQADEYDMVYLAGNEWGGETMARIAREYFETHPGVEFLLVYEHGGWFLGYRRDMTVWDTANDVARLTVPKPQPRRFSGRSVRRGQ